MSRPRAVARVVGDLRLLARVRDVEGLDAVEAERGEAVDRADDVLGRVDVPERVRPDGDAAGVRGWRAIASATVGVVRRR